MSSEAGTWHFSAGGAPSQPQSAEQMRALLRSKVIGPDTLVWTASFGGAWKRACATELWDGPPPLTVAAYDAPADETTAQRLADYQTASGILWIVLGILQVIAIATIIAGIWNIVVGTRRLKLATLIRDRDPQVPDLLPSVGSLVVIGLINLLLGAFIGVALIAVDFYVRDKILSNRHLFG